MPFRLSDIHDPLDAISWRRVQRLFLCCSPHYLNCRLSTIEAESTRVSSLTHLPAHEQQAILDRMRTAASETQAAILAQQLHEN